MMSANIDEKCAIVGESQRLLPQLQGMIMKYKVIAQFVQICLKKFVW